MAARVKRIQASVIDGTAQSSRFKQHQLTKLHDALVKSRSSLVDALRNDQGYSPAEAQIQFYLTISAVSEFHSSLNFEQLLAEEYNIAHSKDNPRRRKGIGCAYIVASQTHQLYSIIVPVAAAIAAGNCVIVEVQQTLSAVTMLLRRTLTATLDANTFAVVDSKPEHNFADQKMLTVSPLPAASTKQSTLLLTMPSARVVAVVDRSAVLMEAAREIVRARFSFSGQSPYAPDLVLVNEFCLKDFCSALAQCASTFLNEGVSGTGQEPHSRKPRANISIISPKYLANGTVTTLASGDRGTIAVVKERSSPLLSSKIGEPILLIHSISSMEDAIDFINLSATPLLATYLFSTPTAAKYLSQFIDAKSSCVNHIPVELLAGPPSPNGFTPSIHPRYTTEMFSLPEPECISVSEKSALLARILDNQVHDNSKAAAKLESPLIPMNEPIGGAVGFFQQAIITGSSLLLSSVVLSMVLAWRYAVPILTARFR